MTPQRLAAAPAQAGTPAPPVTADHPNGPTLASLPTPSMAPRVVFPPGPRPPEVGARDEEAVEPMDQNYAAAAGGTALRLLEAPAPRPAAPQPATTAPPARPSRYRRLLKPCFDRVGAVVGLVLLLPVFLLMALAVLVTMGRPVLFTQQRVGRNGRPLHVIKFRTMHPDRRCRQQSFHEIERRRTHKSDDDPRHTPVGRVLRKLSLDELPQLVNVARGEMSLVGPRPELPEVVQRYQVWQHRRHEVLPGLTGLWQITARGEGLMHERVDLDVRYVDTVSARTDFRILLRTLPAALRRTGS